VAAVLSAMSLAVTSTVVLTGAGAGATTGSAPVFAKSGLRGEGPYPWAYPASGHLAAGTGTTVSGAKCAAGTAQFDSPYAPPCLPKLAGANGGSTYNGVTATTITLVERTFATSADTQEIAAEARAAGSALPQQIAQVQQTFLAYFNKVYELYGRKVVIVPYTTNANFTAEELGQGQAQACADADTIKNQLHAFGEVGLTNGTSFGGTGVFSQCAAQRHLVEFDGDPYFNEATFQQQNPYVWGVAPDCDRIAASEAEVIGTLVAGKKAIYAGDPAFQHKVRKFGTFLPDNPQYGECLTATRNLMEHRYHMPAAVMGPVFKYGLDISTFQQSAQEAVVQFKADGVTTVICSSDPFSLGLLTKAAAAQDYHPEWFLTGSGLTDLDQVAQGLYDQSEIAGHMFGLSESSPSTATTGPASLAGQLYQKLTGHPIPKGTDGNYAALSEIFDALQAAGPDLTPANMARGLHALPTLGAPTYQYGKWSWNAGMTGVMGQGDQTAGEDARFVYWDAGKVSPLNGVKGTFVAVYGGKRFTYGSWPGTLPPLFTAASG
jgi:hypothetical protein